MVEGIFEAVIQELGEAILQLASYGTGWGLVKLLSGGEIKVMSLTTPYEFRPSWYGVGRTSSGLIVLDPDVTALIGMLFWFAVGAALFIWKSMG